MKKLICFLLCLIMLISCVPAMAASLTQESVFGTWTLYKVFTGSGYIDEATLKSIDFSSKVNLHADGTGKISLKYESTKQNDTIYKWTVKSSAVVASIKGYLDTYFYKSGNDLVTYADNLSLYYKKTSEASGKTAAKAITSTGTYKLNNSKNTAAFTAPASKSAKTIKIPDTIKANGKVYKVNEISAKACANMKKLTTLTVGKNVKTIGANAFSGAAKLKNITFTGTALSKIGANAFKNVQKKATVKCPKGKLSKYKKLLKKGGLPTSAKVKGK